MFAPAASYVRNDAVVWDDAHELSHLVIRAMPGPWDSPCHPIFMVGGGIAA
jgi:hypothetical protein